MTQRTAEPVHPHSHATGRYILTGLPTVLPLWVTWLVFSFVLGQLSNAGRPFVVALSAVVRPVAPPLAQWLLESWFQSLLAAVLTLAALYLLGWTATRVIGRRLIAGFEAFMGRLPLIQAIYGAARKFLIAFQPKAGRAQRVVLIDFPSPHMKTIGFVTRVLADKQSGQQLAAVYVPTSPNPTSGYMEIVPIERLTATDWTMDEAMSFIITGGTTGPDSVNYSASAASPARQS